MNITHVCLCGPVTDGFSYQENLLTKYHAKAGNNVSIITSKWVWSSKGRLSKTNDEHYINKDNVEVYRLDLVGRDNFLKKLKIFKGIKSTLNLVKPDVIFIHGVQFLNIRAIIKYKKAHPKVKIYVDNHADYSNSATNWFSKNILHSIIWKCCAKAIEPVTEKFYGVLPARVDFLIDVYNLEKNQVELLPLGADDELIHKYNNPQAKLITKQELRINSGDFVIVTGGKIDIAKKQILLLMEAIHQFKHVKLIVFGSVANELKKEFDELSIHENILYLGWISAEDSYKYFSIADLAIFPGRHSVYWEQVVALGIPLMVKYWEGTSHIDIGGNVIYLKEDSVNEIQDKIENLVENKKVYEIMKSKAQSSKKNTFLYSTIAILSIK